MRLAVEIELGADKDPRRRGTSVAAALASVAARIREAYGDSDVRPLNDDGQPLDHNVTDGDGNTVGTVRFE
jgi:hypothetical protein